MMDAHCQWLAQAHGTLDPAKLPLDDGRNYHVIFFPLISQTVKHTDDGRYARQELGPDRPGLDLQSSALRTAQACLTCVKLSVGMT